MTSTRYFATLKIQTSSLIITENEKKRNGIPINEKKIGKTRSKIAIVKYVKKCIRSDNRSMMTENNEDIYMD